jgi:hypothetical protein
VRQNSTDMAHKKVFEPGGDIPQKPSAAKRTPNPAQGGPQGTPDADNAGAPDQQQDPKRRQGNFEGKGEHARTGNRGR